MTDHRHDYRFVKFRVKGKKKFALYRCKCGDRYETQVTGLLG